MDSTTEIASKFTVADYDQLRPSLDPKQAQADGWAQVLSVFQRRIEERFLAPIARLMERNTSSPAPLVPGFAILALDCLLIDTIQSFREGRVGTGEVSSARSFKDFLKRPRFKAFRSADRGEFFHFVRNGLLHNGETRGDWKVRADKAEMLTRAASGTHTINRTLFHEAIIQEFQEYCDELATGQSKDRELFLRRMDSICGREVKVESYYFAYGSNLLDREIKRTAPNAMAESVRYLPGWRLAFNKHSVDRKGDAASVERCASEMAWGFVYRVSDEDKESLLRREGGYKEHRLTVLCVEDVEDCQACTPQKVFTFVGEVACGNACGAPDEYLQLVLEGAKSRGIPEEYIQRIKEIARS